MEVRKAQPNDKQPVLEFCKTTFSWGDYISDVWDNWFSEGNLLVIAKENKPIAICHASIKDDQLWIEGIRVHPKFRRKGYAKLLVSQAELIGKKNNCKVSKMIIETTNTNSLNLTNNLNYKIEEKWFLHSIYPKKTISKPDIRIAKSENQLIKFLSTLTNSYVCSWRWLPLTKTKISSLAMEEKILITESNDEIITAAIISESDNLERTLMVTLVSTNNDIENFLNYFQNNAYEKECRRIQVLTKIKYSTKKFVTKHSFYLIKKNL